MPSGPPAPQARLARFAAAGLPPRTSGRPAAADSAHHLTLILSRNSHNAACTAAVGHSTIERSLSPIHPDDRPNRERVATLKEAGTEGYRRDPWGLASRSRSPAHGRAITLFFLDILPSGDIGDRQNAPCLPAKCLAGCIPQSFIMLNYLMFSAHWPRRMIDKAFCAPISDCRAPGCLLRLCGEAVGADSQQPDLESKHAAVALVFTVSKNRTGHRTRRDQARSITGDGHAVALLRRDPEPPGSNSRDARRSLARLTQATRQAKHKAHGWQSRSTGSSLPCKRLPGWRKAAITATIRQLRHSAAN